VVRDLDTLYAEEPRKSENRSRMPRDNEGDIAVSHERLIHHDISLREPMHCLCGFLTERQAGSRWTDRGRFLRCIHAVFCRTDGMDASRPHVRPKAPLHVPGRLQREVHRSPGGHRSRLRIGHSFGNSLSFQRGKRWARVDGLAGITKVEDNTAVITRKALVTSTQTPRDPYLY